MKFLTATIVALLLLTTFGCSEDPTVVAADAYKIVELTATFDININGTVTNGGLYATLPYLTGTDATSSDERLISAVLTLGLSNYMLNGLYTPDQNLVVMQADIGTNAYDINCTVTNTGFSGVLMRTVTNSSVFVDQVDFSGVATSTTLKKMQ